VTDRPDRALLHCFAGCDPLDVLQALRLGWGDLFDESATAKGWTADALRRVGAKANGDGRVTLGGVRYLPGAHDDERKTLAAKGATRDLWPDPATVHGDVLFVTEGEPDAVTAAQMGLAGVAVPGTGKWEPSWAQRVAAGRRRVVVVADADEAGRKAAKRWAAAIAEHCADVRVLDLDPARTDGFDLSDYAAIAKGPDELEQAARLLVKTADLAPRCEGVAGGTPSRGVATLPPPSESPINTGVAGLAPPATPATLRRCDVAGMLTTEPAPVDWLIEGVVARGTLTLLAGREKEGKSLVAMACAARGAGGGGTLAGIHVEPLRVLIIDAENGDRELHRRLRSLGLRSNHVARIEVYEASGHDLRRHMHEVEALLGSYKPDLLILDSWRSLWAGDENDSGEVAKVLDPLRNLIRRHNAGAVLIHHMRKNGGYRGSSAIGASVENVMELSRHDEDPDRRRRCLRNPACRYEQEADDRWLRLERDDATGVVLIDETEAFHPSAPVRKGAEDDLLAALDGHPTIWAAWAREAGLDPKDRTARRARDSLVERGRVVQDADGNWTVVA
jgi:KaiC/GvpD/RAD55 family RecA-like ATPase